MNNLSNYEEVGIYPSFMENSIIIFFKPSLRDGLKKNELMEFSIKGPDPASQHP